LLNKKTDHNYLVTYAYLPKQSSSPGTSEGQERLARIKVEKSS